MESLGVVKKEERREESARLGWSRSPAKAHRVTMNSPSTMY